MIDNFKFFEGKVYTDEFEFPRVRRSLEHIGRGYIQTILPTVPNLATLPEPNYDAMVINIVRRRMNLRLSWRGYQMHVFEPDGYPLLKIVSGINIGGMFHIVYLITRDGNTENYRVSVPLINLQRRG